MGEFGSTQQSVPKQESLRLFVEVSENEREKTDNLDQREYTIGVHCL